MGRTLGIRSVYAAGLLLIVLSLAAEVHSANSTEFERRLARVDRALKKNPNFVPIHALNSCLERRSHATHLFARGHHVRASRSLTYCFNLLGISETSVAPPPDPDAEAKRIAAATARVKGKADRESDEVHSLEPNIANGLEVYRGCASCHTPEGWGLSSGVVPQLAGQHRSVVIKQLADIRAGYRKNRVMAPYSTVEAIGGAQAIADVAGYIDTLEISVENGRGPGDDLAHGEKLYKANCAACHGVNGEGSAEERVPRIHAQHFGYLVTQFELIRDGSRRNANPEMVAQIKNFEERDINAVMDYVSRLSPPAELVAPPGWRNPDFMTPPASKN